LKSTYPTETPALQHFPLEVKMTRIHSDYTVTINT